MFYKAAVELVAHWFGSWVSKSGRIDRERLLLELFGVEVEVGFVV